MHGFGQWKIVTKGADIIGIGGLSYKMFGNEEKLNLGYRIDEKFWGKGYATKIAHFAIHYGVSILNKKRFMD
nr:GNAT family N-acetyltransferase [Spirochaeta cellobiosiphila]